MGEQQEQEPLSAMLAGQPPTLEQMQQWTHSLGRAQQLILEHAANALHKVETEKPPLPDPETLARQLPYQPETLARIQTDFAKGAMALWERFFTAGTAMVSGTAAPSAAEPVRDRRFADPRWQSHPFFNLVRQSYQLTSDYMLRLSDAVDGVDPKHKEQIRFATRALVDALSPSNFPLTNPVVLEKTIETNGENLVRGLQHMLADMDKGQLTHTDGTRFELGRNIAATPGKVIHETPLYQLIHYTPTTKKVLETPVIVFPPWINRFYILDLAPEKSFVKWAVDQGLSVFMVSWKSADESMKDIEWADYILRGQIDAIDTVRDLLGVPSVHTIGYCVAGTTLAATLALLAARGEADKVKSATFFTAQVDFREAGDLTLFVDDETLKLVDQLSSVTGYLDGRYMAATFNLLRGRDLIWNYVVNNYLLWQDYPPFDLLYWNGDTTNLPRKWHREYLTDLYRDNKLATPGAIRIDGTPIELHRVATPCYAQAGREDHIAPPRSVWKITEHFTGPLRFVLAGSGHIAGVVNPPSAGKYQYWTCEKSVASLEDFIRQAKETPGGWWGDWHGWLTALEPAKVPAKGARVPGKGKLRAIEDAPGRYVKSR